MNSRGGQRMGSGRPDGSGLYGEKTTVIRVPTSTVLDIKGFLESRKQEKEQILPVLPPGVEIWKAHPDPHILKRPLGGTLIQAGFPSPADDYLERSLDLNELLVPEPESTFYVTLSGLSLVDMAIVPGDILVVNRARSPQNGNVIVAIVDGEFTVKKLDISGNRIALVPENKMYKPIVLREGQELQCWGVVTGIVRKLL